MREATAVCYSIDGVRAEVGTAAKGVWGKWVMEGNVSMEPGNVYKIQYEKGSIYSAEHVGEAPQRNGGSGAPTSGKSSSSEPRRFPSRAPSQDDRGFQRRVSMNGYINAYMSHHGKFPPVSELPSFLSMADMVIALSESEQEPERESVTIRDTGDETTEVRDNGEGPNDDIPF